MSAAEKTAEKGEKPGGIMAQTRQVTGTVTEIDQQNRKVTLDFGDGRKRVFPVREDIDLAKQKVGDKVVFSYTETIAVSVEKP
jgi:Cu/Ag efflux protein CusF